MKDRGRRRWVMPLVWLLGVFGLLAAGFWAGRTIGQPAAAPLQAASTTTYVASSGTVGNSLPNVARAQWKTTVVAKSASSGTVTSVDLKPGQSVRAGDRVWSVDLRPTVIAQGKIPAFRDIGPGTRGPDVAQLQRLLASVRPGLPASGVFNTATQTAVKAWQQSLGETAAGTVKLGDVIFVPSLPARLVVNPDIAVGSVVTPGQDVVSLVADAPTIEVDVRPEQTQLIPQQGPVVMHPGPDKSWPGKIADSRNTTTGDVYLALSATDGSPICGADCAAAIPLGDPTNIPVDIVVISPQTGPEIPVAAITTHPDNSTTVTLADGTTRPVTVKASLDGLAVVSGIDVGTTVLIPVAAQATE